MKCIHCGKEIDQTSRFCIFCGGSQQVTPAAPPKAVPAAPVGTAPAKKPVDIRWIIAFVWLGLVIIGWLAALFLIPVKTKPMENAGNENPPQEYRLTEGTWYQWDAGSGKLYSWNFDGNGTASYGIPGEKTTYTTQYRVDGDGNVRIGYDEDGVLWEYDALTHSYWLYTEKNGQIYKTHIISSASDPAGTAECYTYRTDNGSANISISFTPVTKLDADTAQMIVGWYNHYGCFGVCADWENVSQDEAVKILLSAGYSRDDVNLYGVKRIKCCNSLAQSRSHAVHYLDDSMLPGANIWTEGAVEYNGRLYMIVPPMGYEGYYVDGEVTDYGDGTWSVPLKYFDETTPYTAHFVRIDGTIKLIAIQKTQSGIVPGSAVLTEDTAWNLISRMDTAWLLYYFQCEGIVDEADRYTFYPHEDKSFGVDCPSVIGVDTPEQLYNLLRRHCTERYADQFLQVSYVDDQRGNIYSGQWFCQNGTVYFEPNWGAGTQMLFRETMVIVQTDENSWTVSMEMEFTDERAQFHIVCENGTFKLDI